MSTPSDSDTLVPALHDDHEPEEPDNTGEPAGARLNRTIHAWVRGPHGGPFSSLRVHLILTNLGVAALVMAVLGGALFFYQQHQVASQIDRQLAAEAAHELAKGQALLNATTPGSATEHYQPDSPNLFSIVLSKQHTVLEDDEGISSLGLSDWSAAQEVLDGEVQSTYATIQRGGIRYRVYAEQVQVDGQTIGVIQTGTSLKGADEQTADFIRTLLFLSIGVLLLTFISSIYLTDRALKPARHAFTRQRQFAFAASHELRTPLAYIRSQAELLTQHRCPQEPSGNPRTTQTEDADEVAADAQEIISEVDYMSRLTHRLLLLARDENDRRALAWERLDVASLARDSASRVLPRADEKGLTLEVKDTPAASGYEEPAVYGDQDMLRELLIILLDNAVRYTPAGGKIWVEVRTERRSHVGTHHASHVLMRVSDTGKGIEPEHLPSIFEPFYRADHARTHDPATTGSGLGLALANWIAHAHNGTITVSSHPGRGSTFTVTLPRAD